MGLREIQLLDLLYIFSFLLGSRFSLGSCSTLYRQHTRRDPACENSPSQGYAPIHVRCPAGFEVRVAASHSECLGKLEADYVAQKSANSSSLWEGYLRRAELLDFEYESFFSKTAAAGENVPNIGIALSGGGIRALLGEAGILHAFDDRNPDAVKAGTGGILQLANYMSGLSGGSWLLGSWAINNYPTFTELNRTVWKLSEKSSYTSWNSVKRYPEAVSRAQLKSQAGFPASLVDVQAYMLSRHLINDTHHGSRVLFSTIKNTTEYKNRRAPFPILLSKSRVNGVTEIDYDSPIYEFNPEEFGVCDSNLKAFIPLEYLGSEMIGGKPADSNSCVKGFDNAGFIIGASSNILSQPGVSNFSWKKILPEAYDQITRHVYDEAIIPNPFYRMGLGTQNGNVYPDQNSSNIYLADGGWGGEILPFWPLLQPSRKLDAILAVDYSADGPSMFRGALPNGTSLFQTYLKTQKPEYQEIHFPRIPDPSGPFSEQGLNKRPTFFGCNEVLAPMIIYFPNYQVVTNTEQATMKAQYDPSEIDAFFQNSFAIATQTIPDIQSNGFQYNPESIQMLLDRAGPVSRTGWKTCLACALIDRQLRRNNTPRSAQCELCFERYCA